MRTWLGVALLLGWGVAQSFGQGAQADQIKHRARNLADQSNVQQGIPPAGPRPMPQAPPPPAAKPATASTPAATSISPQQKNVAAIRADLGLLVATNSLVSRQRFATTLLSAARGTGKPTGVTVRELSDALAAAVTGAKLSSAQLDRLAQNLEGAVNPAGMARAQTEAIVEDVQSVLRKGGVSAPAAAVVASDLQRFVTEAQTAPGK